MRISACSAVVITRENTHSSTEKLTHGTTTNCWLTQAILSSRILSICALPAKTLFADSDYRPGFLLRYFQIDSDYWRRKNCGIELRRQKAQPIVAALKARVESARASALPRSAVGKASDYTNGNSVSGYFDF